MNHEDGNMIDRDTAYWITEEGALLTSDQLLRDIAYYGGLKAAARSMDAVPVETSRRRAEGESSPQRKTLRDHLDQL